MIDGGGEGEDTDIIDSDVFKRVVDEAGNILGCLNRIRQPTKSENSFLSIFRFHVCLKLKRKKKLRRNVWEVIRDRFPRADCGTLHTSHHGNNATERGLKVAHWPKNVEKLSKAIMQFSRIAGAPYCI